MNQWLDTNSVDLVLTGLQWLQCLVYLDDIIVLGHSFEEHIRNLDSVFQRLQESGLRLKLSKCSLFKTQVWYLGHVISRDGVATDLKKTAKVAIWPAPTTKREVQQLSASPATTDVLSRILLSWHDLFTS